MTGDDGEERAQHEHHFGAEARRRAAGRSRARQRRQERAGRADADADRRVDLNSCAATWPASPRGSVANKAGAATKPTPAIMPGPAPASQHAARRIPGLTRSLVADRR